YPIPPLSVLFVFWIYLKFERQDNHEVISDERLVVILYRLAEAPGVNLSSYIYPNEVKYLTLFPPLTLTECFVMTAKSSSTKSYQFVFGYISGLLPLRNISISSSEYGISAFGFH